MTRTPKDVPYPGIPTTTDGSGAVVWVETHITQGACAYPITSSTPMGVGYQAAVANGQKNLWGEPLVFLEAESEHSSASAAEGFALAGGRVANFTSGQGLILMKEVLFTISGKRLPAVFHIGARALTSQALNVHAGHDDVMGVADTGWGMLLARNAQEAGDFALIARRVAEETQTPFFNVQDGFLTTHTIENVRLPEPELMKAFVGDPREKLKSLMDPHHPVMSGVVQNQDSYMKGKIAQRYFYDRILPALEAAFEEFARLTGRRYGTILPYRMEGAKYAFVAMGTLAEMAEAVVDYLRDVRKVPVGCVSVLAFRPFPGPQLVEALKEVEAVIVLERMDNPTAQSNPLTAELKAAFADALTGAGEYPLDYPKVDRIPLIYSGSAGLGSRDVRPGDYLAALEFAAARPKRRYFVLGIDHPLALERTEDPDLRPAGSFSLRGHSVGGFGSVTTNKVMATLIADLLGLYVQAYPKYGSEKKGLPTNYFLTAAPEKVRIHSELKEVEFVALNDANAFNLSNPLAGLKENGTLFLHSPYTTPEEVWAHIPNYAKEWIRRRGIRVLALDTVKIAREVAPSADLEQRMQGIVLLGVFLRVAPFIQEKGLTLEDVMGSVEKSLRKYFGKRGEAVVKANLEAVRRGYHEVFEIPREIIEGQPRELAEVR